MKCLIAFAHESTCTELFLLICTIYYPWIPNYHIKSIQVSHSLSLASASPLNTEQTDQTQNGARPFPVRVSLVYYWTTSPCKQ